MSGPIDDPVTLDACPLSLRHAPPDARGAAVRRTILATPPRAGRTVATRQLLAL